MDEPPLLCIRRQIYTQPMPSALSSMQHNLVPGSEAHASNSAVTLRGSVPVAGCAGPALGALSSSLSPLAGIVLIQLSLRLSPISPPHWSGLSSFDIYFSHLLLCIFFLFFFALSPLLSLSLNPLVFPFQKPSCCFYCLKTAGILPLLAPCGRAANVPAIDWRSAGTETDT